MAERILTGDKALDRKLKFLERKAANRAARAGLGKGARLAAKKIKAEVPSSLKSVRRAIGHSVKKGKGGITTAKAGAAVGKASKAKAPKRSSGGGVGISRANIHWWILGTGDRTQKTTGRATGKMPAHGVVKAAVAKSMSSIKSAIREGVKSSLMRAAKKKV